MNNNKIVIGFIIVTLIALGGYAFPVAKNLFGAEGDSNVTNLVASGYITVGGGSTASKFVCATASWNPPSLASSGNPFATSGTSTVLTFSTSSVFSSFTANRPIDVSLEITTTTPFTIAGFNLAGGATTSINVALQNLAGSAFDAVTSTIDACQWQ